MIVKTGRPFKLDRTIPNKKVCTKCKRILPIDQYSMMAEKQWDRRIDPHISECKLCRKLQQIYHITYADYEILLTSQQKVCAICGDKQSTKSSYLDVDHDHTTGAVRGLLCGNCNRGLGQFHDDIPRLRKAVNYLERYRRDESIKNVKAHDKANSLEASK